MAKKKRPTRRARPVVDVPPSAAHVAPGTPGDVALPLEGLESPDAGGAPPGDVAGPSATAPPAPERPREPTAAELRHPPSLTLKHDRNRFLVGRMHPDTIAEFRRIIANTPELLGAGAGEQLAAVEEVPDELVTAIYDGISGLGAWLLARSGKFSVEQLRTVMFLDGDEQRAVTPLTKKLLQKYLPAGAGQYTDEIALAFLLYSIFQRKQQQLAQILERRGAGVSDFPRAAAAPQV